MMKKYGRSFWLRWGLLGAVLLLMTGCEPPGPRPPDDPEPEPPWNSPPSIRRLTANPTSVQPGGTSRVTVEASDPDGDRLRYSWRATGGSVSPSSGRSSVTWTAPQAPGTYRVTVTVRDNQGGRRSKSVNITVTRANKPPAIDSLTANPASVVPGGSSTVTVDASDPDDDTLTYSWSTTGDATVSPRTSHSSITWTAPRVEHPTFGGPSPLPTTYTVTVTVRDNQGGSVRQSINITVAQPNSPPRIDWLRADPTSVPPGGTSTLLVTAEDPDFGDSLTYSWSASGGTITGGGFKLPFEAIWTAPPVPGVYTVTVTVSDGRGGQTSASVPITVTAPPPPPPPPARDNIGIEEWQEVPPE